MEVQYLFLLILGVCANNDKDELCSQLFNCEADEVQVCGVRLELGGVRFRLFENECELLRYSCGVSDNMTYGAISFEYCTNTFSLNLNNNNSQINIQDLRGVVCKECDLNKSETNDVCGIRQDGKGFKIRLFHNKCDLDNFNCKNNVEFLETDYYICNGIEVTKHNKKATNSPMKNNQLTDSFKINDDINNDYFKKYESDNSPLENNQPSSIVRRKIQLNVSELAYTQVNWVTDNYEIINKNSAEHNENSTDIFHSEANDNTTQETINSIKVNDYPLENEDVHINLKKGEVNNMSTENVEVYKNQKEKITRSPITNDDVNDYPIDNQDVNNKLKKGEINNGSTKNRTVSDEVNDSSTELNNYTVFNTYVNYLSKGQAEVSDSTLKEHLLEGLTEQYKAAGSKNISDQGQQELNNTEILVVVDGSIFKPNSDINDTIDNFFAATHVMDLPLRSVEENKNNRRAVRINLARPYLVFQPWHVIPKNISDDHDHWPTLNSCYHKCPKKCPDMYAPVCGNPGVKAREPAIMFRNHCLMDVAQCKMRWEDKSTTAISSAYLETSFLFCLGDELNSLYRFLPLVKTLQHMGRLKKKANFKYIVRNMKHYNNFMASNPKLMG